MNELKEDEQVLVEVKTNPSISRYNFESETDEKRTLNMKKSFYILVLTSLVLASCSKDDAPVPVPNRPNNFSEIKVEDNFRWETGVTVTVKVKGNPTLSTVINTLSLVNENGEVFTSKLHNMNDNAEFVVELPSNVTKIKMQYGEIVKEATVSSVVSFDFLPALSNEE